METETRETTAQAPAVKQKKSYYVPFTELEIIPDLNVRIGELPNIPDLADNILANGVKVAISGIRKNNKFHPIHGHRRQAAGYMIYHQAVVNRLGETVVITLNEKEHKFDANNLPSHLTITPENKVVIIYPFDLEVGEVNNGQRIIDMIVTNTGEPLNPLELAAAVKRLMDLEGEEWDEKSIGKKLSLSPVYVNRLCLLNGASEEYKKIVAGGKISPTLALELLAKGQTEKFVKEFKAGKYDTILAKMERDANKPAKLTRKDIAPPSSIALFKKMVKEGTEIPEAKKDTFFFLGKFVNNELTAQELYDFFLKN